MAKIVPLSPADITSLVQLENELFDSDRISPRQFRYLITRAQSIAVKIDQEGELLGYMILLKRRTSRKLRLYSIAVRNSERNRGLARQLLATAEQLARQQQCIAISLEVCETNAPALSLYAAVGFRPTGRKEGYYEDGCTAICCTKTIN